MNNVSKQVSVETLAEEYLERKRRGESPAISEYKTKYPDLADEIEDIFPAMELMENFKPASGDLSDESASSRPAVPNLKQVADYRILKEIGRGGMGVVYEAEQQSLGRRVALKVLPQSSVGGTKMLDRFQREARAAAKMHHTNIVPVFEVGSDDQCAFYAMQLIQGQGLDAVVGDLRDLRSAHTGSQNEPNPNQVDARNSLAHSLVTGHFDCAKLDDSASRDEDDNNPVLIDTIVAAGESTVSASLPGEGDLSTAEDNRRAYFRSVAEIGHQCAEALSYAHARGIVHRDIKPSNLLLDTNGVVWVTDFGLAKTNDVGLTQTGDILGTIRYMSPECFKGQCDNRADVYSLGLTLYEMLVLKPAFESPDRLKLIDIVTKIEVTSPRSIDSRIPRDLETIVLKACDKDPKRRYQSADDMAEDLQRFLNDEPILARRVSPTERVARWSRRNPWLATAMSVSAAALIAISGISMVAAQTQSDLNERLTEANAEQKQLNDDLKQKTDEQRKTNQELVATNRSKEELIRDLKRSQSRLAEKQAEFIAEKGDLAESMLWLAKSYELADGQKPEFRKHLLTKLEASAARMPQLRGIEVTPAMGGRLFADTMRGRMLNATDEDRMDLLMQLRVRTTRANSVLSQDQTLMAIPVQPVETSDSDIPIKPQEIRVWDVGTASYTGQTISPEEPPFNLAVHAGKRLLAGLVWRHDDAAALPPKEGSNPLSRFTGSKGSLILCVWSIDSGMKVLEREIESDLEFSRTMRESPIHFRSDAAEIVRVSGKSLTQGVAVKAHSVETGEVVRTAQFSPKEPGILSASFISADGQRIVMAAAPRSPTARGQSGETTLTWHDIDSGEQIGETIQLSLQDARTGGNRMSLLTPNGSRVAVLSGIGKSQRIEILDFDTGEPLGGAIEVSHSANRVTDILNANPIGTHLAVAVREPGFGRIGRPASEESSVNQASLPVSGFVQVFDVATGTAVAPPLPTPGTGELLLAMPEAALTWSVRAGEQIRTWQLPHSQTHRVLIPWRGLAPIQSMPTFAQRMSMAVQLAQGRRSSRLTDLLHAPVVELAIDQQKNVIVAEQNQTGIHLRTWDRKTGRVISQKHLPSTGLHLVGMFSSGGKYLMTGHVGSEPDAVSQLQLWRTETGTKHGEPFDMPRGISVPSNTPLAVSPGGESVLFRRLVRLPQPAERADESTTPSRPGSRFGAGNNARSRTGRGFGGGMSMKLVVVNLDTGEEKTLPQGLPAVGHFSDEGRFLFLSASKNRWRYDLQSGTLDPPTNHPESGPATADSNARAPSRGGFGFSGPVSGFRGRPSRAPDLSGDGNLMATIVDDTVVQIRPVGADGQLGSAEGQVTELQHPSAVTNVVFDAENKLVITATVDGLIRQWSLPERWNGTPDEIRQRVQRHTGIALSETDEVAVADVAETFGKQSNGAEPKLMTSSATFLTTDDRDALRLRNARQWEKAEAALKKWASLRPEDWQPIVLSIRPLVELNKFDEADDMWDRAVTRVGREAAYAWLKIDFDTQASVSTPQGRSWYHRHMLEFAPDDATKAALLFQMAKADEVEFRFDEAVEAINQAVALAPNSADMHYYRAHLMERLSRWDEALESREAVLRLNPEHAESPYRVVTAILFAGDDKAFRRSWSNYLASNEQLLGGEKPNLGVGDRIAKPRLLAGGSHDEGFQRALEIADADFNGMGTSSLQDWMRLCKGLAEYRRGEPKNLNAAIEQLDSAYDGFKNSRSFQRGTGITRFIAAMAHHKLGNSELAEATYLEGLDRHQHQGSTLRQSTTAVANDWQQAEVARREAAALLKFDPATIDQPVVDTTNWTILMVDNFGDGISDDWQQMTGQWSVVDGAACGTLQQPEGGFEGYGRLERAIPDLPDTFEIEYETWTSEPMLAACFLRLPSEERAPIGHRVALTSVPDRLFVTQGKPGMGVSLVTNETFGAWANQSVSDFKVETGQHYKVRIIRQPQRITAFIDGEQILSERVRNIATRSIRFFARGDEGAKMFVDDVRIRIPHPTSEQHDE